MSYWWVNAQDFFLAASREKKKRKKKKKQKKGMQQNKYILTNYNGQFFIHARKKAFQAVSSG